MTDTVTLSKTCKLQHRQHFEVLQIIKHTRNRTIYQDEHFVKLACDHYSYFVVEWKVIRVELEKLDYKSNELIIRTDYSERIIKFNNWDELAESIYYLDSMSFIGVCNLLYKKYLDRSNALICCSCYGSFYHVALLLPLTDPSFDDSRAIVIASERGFLDIVYLLL
jgi:hypothetical protein